MEGENAKQCMEGDTKCVGAIGCEEPSHPNLLVKALLHVELEVDETAVFTKFDAVELEISAKLEIGETTKLLLLEQVV